MTIQITYSFVARFWAVVFFLVGLSFLIIPYEVAVSLNQIAHAVGLSGEITAPVGNLWQVLSLSLMSCVTLCAWFSANNPNEGGVYVALVVAKLVSTAGFIVLTTHLASAWLVCAVADGFVAITLMLSRRRKF